MIGTVIPNLGRVAAGHDSTRATVIEAGRRHGVLVVVAAWFVGQQTLAIFKHHTITSIRQSLATLNLAQRFDGLDWQV